MLVYVSPAWQVTGHDVWARLWERDLKAQMRAIECEPERSDAGTLHIGQRAVPSPSAGQIRIAVRAAGVNRPDISQREGNYPPPPGATDIIGLEVAGTVDAVGEGAQRWKVGDEVCALLPGGGYAEYAIVDARHALPIPKGLAHTQAAGLPETVFTVWANLFESGRLTGGETVLIHGANSGIGATAIMMAKAAGARVIATARGTDKVSFALSLGADIGVDTTTQDFAAICADEGGVDVILDIVGGSFFTKNVEALKTDGRLVQIAFLEAREVSLDLLPLLFKRLTICGSTLRGRDADEKARLAAAIENTVWPWVEQGQFSLQAPRLFDLAEAADAHRCLEAGEQRGKVVLKI